jgi:ribonuclease Y
MAVNLDIIILIPMAVVLVALFFYFGWIFNSRIGKKSLLSAEEKAKQMVADAQKEANNLKREKLLEVKDEWYKKKLEFDAEINQKRQKIQRAHRVKKEH